MSKLCNKIKLNNGGVLKILLTELGPANGEIVSCLLFCMNLATLGPYVMTLGKIFFHLTLPLSQCMSLFFSGTFQVTKFSIVKPLSHDYIKI